MLNITPKILAFITFIGISNFLGSQTINWAKMLNSKDITVITSLANSSGDLIVFGTFSGTVDFDPSSTTYNLVSAGGSDLFIARYKNNGSFSFAKRIGNSSTETALDMVLDKNNNIIISGKVYGVVDMNPSTSTNNIGASGQTKSFLASYSSMGTYSWVNSFSGQLNLVTIATDGTNRVITAGHFAGVIDMDPSSATNNISSVSGSTDVFLATYSSSGSYVWAHSFGNNYSTERAVDITVSSFDNIYITGTFQGNIDFDPGIYDWPGIPNFTTNTDAYLSMFFSDGTFRYARNFGGTGVINPKQILIGGYDIYITGTFTKSIEIDLLNPVTASGSSTDVFLVHYQHATFDVYGGLYPIWLKKFGGTSTESVATMGFDDHQMLLLWGDFSGTVDFDPSSATHNLYASGSKDLYFLRLDEDGDYVFADNIGNSNTEVPKSLAFDFAHNQFFLIGDFYGTVDFKMGTSGSSTSLTASSSSKRTFIAKYDISSSTLQEVNPHVEPAEFMHQEHGLPQLPAVKVIPNPTSGETTLQFEGVTFSNASQIHVFDFSGREVLSNTYDLKFYGTNATIDVAKLNAGIYILAIETEGRFIQEKFIKE